VPNWNKIKNLSLDEVRVRGAQKLAALRERRGWSSLGRLPNDKEFSVLLTGLSGEDLLEQFRSRTTSKFFAGLEDRRQTVAEFRARWPEKESELLDQAKRIVEGKFDLLGYHGLSFGEPIDWHLEPILDKRAPLIHWSQLDYLNADTAGDKKIIWELNRHQYFMTLGQAYWLSGDEQYAQTFLSHLESWMDENPPKLGINWASSLEVSFRSISWLWALHFFKESTSLSAASFKRTVQFLYLNARHLETYLSTYFSPNTHLTGEALGLFYLGLLLPEFKEASRWRELGQSILVKQLPIHVRSDGVYFEQSSYYHRYTVDFYLHFLILSQANSLDVSGDLENELELLLDHLMYITRPDGSTPFFGDDDGGRLVKLDRRPANDFRAALATGSVLLSRGDYKFISDGPAEETLWLLGQAGLNRFDEISAREPEQQSVAFESGGYYVMRDGWTNTANFLLFDCGPHGQANCGHAHADALAFDLAGNGRTLLVDPGTFTYTGAKELRDWFRGSSAHNTLTIDGRSSSTPAGPFSWETIAKCKCNAWLSNKDFDYVAASHDGYGGGPRAAEHERRILFLKQNYWVIRDHVSTISEARVDIWFHFAPKVNPLIEAEVADRPFISIDVDQMGLDLFEFGKNGRWRREEGWVSQCYSQREPAKGYVFSAHLDGKGDFVSFIVPRRSAEKRRQVREIEAIGGQAFEVTNDDSLDLVMIRAGELVETAQIASDFEWTWAKFSKEDETVPKELVLINGKNLRLQGKQLLCAGQEIRCLTAKREGGMLRVVSDRGSFEWQLKSGDLAAAFSRLS